MTQITYPTLFLITHLYPIDTRWIEFLPRLHHGLTEGLTGGGQIGFSDWWWQMAVLTQAEEMFCCWKYKVLNGEATEKSVPRGMLRITITLLRCSSQPGPDRDSFEVAPCAHVGCVQPAVMWVHCLHAAEISERACVCVCPVKSAPAFTNILMNITPFPILREATLYPRKCIMSTLSRWLSGPRPVPQQEQKADLRLLMSGTVCFLISTRKTNIPKTNTCCLIFSI